MRFVFHSPPAALAGSVKAVWTARGDREEFASPEPIVPDGCVEIVFNLGAPFINGTTGATQPRALLAGQMTAPVVAVPTGDVDLIGVRFRTSRAGAALRVAMWRLQDALIDATAVNARLAPIADTLRELRSVDRIPHLVHELTRCLSPVDEDRLAAVETALAIIDRRRGNVSIESVARGVGVSRRHLERRFRNEVGLRVKHVARIARVHSVLRAMASRPTMSGADLAAACGFSDQAHLIRDCKALTGKTPAAFMTTTVSLSRHLRDR